MSGREIGNGIPLDALCQQGCVEGWRETELLAIEIGYLRTLQEIDKSDGFLDMRAFLQDSQAIYP